MARHSLGQSLKGYRALVTGASSGIGEAFARELAARGADIVLAARRMDRLEALGAKLRADHQVAVECIRVDLSDPRAPEALFAAATSGGKRVQILVNNAGLGAYGPFLERPLEKHLDTVRVNVLALTELSYRFAQHMRGHGEPSFISNVGSIASFQSSPGYAVYGGSKHYVRVFSETLAHELVGTNVRVHCLCPGGVLTEFIELAGQELTKSGQSMMMTADEVARISVESMLKGARTVVPGFLNKLSVFLPRFLPRGAALKIAEKAMDRAVKIK